ncbi:MAG: aromatic amino acid aminotransferase [Bacillales bacterium]|jgi:aminotransferase|nr:aromatic amino acid aminotransferase [Bacillales bacterium]
MLNFNQNVEDIQISGIRTFMREIHKIDDLIQLTIGQPDFDTPTPVKNAAIDAINNNQTSYTDNAGKLDLRNAVSSYLKEKYSLIYNPNSEIIITNGATGAIDISLRAILSEGDEVILPAPIYPGYEPVITLCKAKAVHIDTSTTNFKYTREQLEKCITEKTKCIIFPFPSNPTGATMNKDEYETILPLLEKNNIWLLCDEIYSELTYMNEHFSLANFPSLKNKTIVINGLSKSHSMTGWRVGFLMGSESFISQALKVQQYSTTCISSISQAAALAAVTTSKDDSKIMLEEYRKRKDYVYSRLTKVGFDVVNPNGAFYFFIDHRKYNANSYDFAIQLANNAKVGVIPGSVFSNYGDGFFRLSYAYSMDTLKKALDRIENYINLQ